jgi:hypothetical protein
MKYYIPFKEIKKSTPMLSLSKSSKNIKIKDIGKLNSTVFVEDSYKELNKSLSPSPIMTLNVALVVNEKIKNFITEIDATINIEQACYIKSDNEYIEDYWVITPSINKSVIDLEKSVFDVTVIDEDMPSLNMYDFEKIVVNKEIRLNTIFFREPYLRDLVITEEFLNFLRENKLTGLSFMDIENYEDWKTVEHHEDHIII